MFDYGDLVAEQEMRSPTNDLRYWRRDEAAAARERYAESIVNGMNGRTRILTMMLTSENWPMR